MLPSPYCRWICRQCLAQSTILKTQPRFFTVRTSAAARVVPKRLKSSLSNSSTNTKNDNRLVPIVPNYQSPPEEAKLLIRQRLRLWAEQNPNVRIHEMPSDVAFIGDLANTMSRTQSTGSTSMDQFGVETTGTGPTSVIDASPTDAGISYVGAAAHNPGDLIEMRMSSSRVVNVAIYVGFFGGCNHFYSINGRWSTSTSVSSAFTIPGFASLEELSPILEAIPKDGSPDEYAQMQRDDNGPTRERAAHLLAKMTCFRDQADNIAKMNIGVLDSAHSHLSSPSDSTHLSLVDMAEVLLPQGLKTSRCHSYEALYAVHMAVLSKQTGFSCLNISTDSRRSDNIYEIFSRDHVATIGRVVSQTRGYVDQVLSAPNRYPKRSNIQPMDLLSYPLGSFIITARKVVQRSRRQRPWTPAGLSTLSSPVNLGTTNWDTESRDVIAFLEWWAGYDLFVAGSRYNSYGAIILRALDLYDNVDFNQATAWTFLQEIGCIPAWDLPTRYRVRLPGVEIVKQGGLTRKVPDGVAESLRPDIAANARKPVSCHKVFCIDDASTMLIDDGISLERTDKADEFWIHVHTADPASGIEPNSDLYKYMELIPQNIYLPGYFQAMLPSEVSQEDSKDYQSNQLAEMYSLRSKGLALTFSAKVNEAGDILDYKIEPSILDEVVALEPSDIERFCNEQRQPAVDDKYNFSVGAKPAAAEDVGREARSIMTTENLDEASKADIQTLHRLGQAMQDKRLAKGAWPYFSPRPTVNVCFHQIQRDQTDESQIVPPDPYIEVGLHASHASSLVTNCMLLAGQIAARWCRDRGIPIPYRRDVKQTNTDEAFRFATTKVYPRVRDGLEPRREDWQHLRALTGGVEISPEPGPYFMLGLDMYTKTTSPLRRFSDLLVHWQIHAALAYERQKQRRIDPAQDKLQDIVPFSGPALSQTLGMLELREKMANRLSQAVSDWIMIALDRAWRVEGTAPRTLRFTVSSCSLKVVQGRLDMYGLSAALNCDGLEGCCLIRDVHVGDVFEVKIANIVIQSRSILVKALRRLGRQGNGATSIE